MCQGSITAWSGGAASKHIKLVEPGWLGIPLSLTPPFPPPLPLPIRRCMQLLCGRGHHQRRAQDGGGTFLCSIRQHHWLAAHQQPELGERGGGLWGTGDRKGECIVVYEQPELGERGGGSRVAGARGNRAGRESMVAPCVPFRQPVICSDAPDPRAPLRHP